MGHPMLDFYATPGPMTVLPEHPALDDVPVDLDDLRAVVQGLLVHRDWAPMYGLTADQLRLPEQHLRTAVETLDRAFEMSAQPVTVRREPVDRVLTTCRNFALLYTALLRDQGVPARVRCGFANYFDRSKWFDHFITERWDGERWVRDDAQVDDLQRQVVSLDIDPHDQPAGHFLTGGEAWLATRAGEADPDLFGIFDMWGAAYIGGNVLLDLACLNKVELLPWDGWGMPRNPFEPVPDKDLAVYDELALLTGGDDFDAMRHRYLNDDAVRVPADITSFQDGTAVEAHLDLW